MKFLKKYRYPIIFISPAFVLLFVFAIFAMFVALGISFTDMNLKGLADFSNVSFVGLKNYFQVFNDPDFSMSLGNTLYYVFYGVPFVIMFSLGLALLLHISTSKLSNVFRAVYYAPAITNMVAIAVVWTFLYNGQYGLFNQILNFFGIPGLEWLTQVPETSSNFLYSILPFSLPKNALIIMAVWKSLGLNMIIFLAALKGIPVDLYEAASIDGATSWQKFKSITIPSLGYATFFVTITTLLGWFQFFEEPFIMTQGGPLGATKSIALFIYEKGFSMSNFGYAGAASMILFLILMVVTLVQTYVRKKTEH